MDYQYEINTRDELVSKLTAYAENPDDATIRCKEIIKDQLLHCPELLYLFHETAFEEELFDTDGNLNPDGDWDMYYGDHGNIRPYLYIPDTQTQIKHFLCYRVQFSEVPDYNRIEKYLEITFYIFVNGEDVIEPTTGLCRHDLMSSILREKFNWSNAFGTQCRVISDAENITDNYFLTRTVTLQLNYLNSIVKTDLNGKTSVINNVVRTR